MKLFKILFAALIAYVPTAWSAVDYNIKYSSNYLMPAYVYFKADGSQYSVNAKINIPLYNIVFTSRGSQTESQFKMVNYQDVRNGKPYAISKISPNCSIIRADFRFSIGIFKSINRRLSFFLCPF